MKVRANGIDIEVEDTGADGGQADRPVVVLIMGLGMQLVAWPPSLVQALVASGLRVVRFDNRDAGLSQKFDALGVPNLLVEGLRLQFGLAVRTPYPLQALALDTLGVLDALGIADAHVVGASMGGMVAQRVAIAAPRRVRTLTSIMSTSGARYLPGPRPQVARALLGRPRDGSEDAIVDHVVHLFQLIGSPGFPTPEPDLRERIRLLVRRSYAPAGTARQLAAVAADVRRADELPGITAPTLVFHGLQDPLVPFACGHDTALRIPGARLVGVPGMGHDLAPGVVDRLLEALVPHLR